MIKKIKQFWNWIERTAKRFWKWLIAIIFGGIVLASGLGGPEIISINTIEKFEQAPQELKAKYELKENSLKISNNKEKDKLDVLVGGKEKFEPKLEVQRWDNEVGFSIKLIENEKASSSLSFDKDKIVWEKGNLKIEYFDTEDAYKFVWYLETKPASNIVQFEVESRGVDFYYQPELTQEEIDDGCVRPENVVGSYAVYASEQKINWNGGTEYKTGKVGHIYRPRLKDSNGWEVWGDLHIENGIYQVTIPQDFYDNAVYPIRSNDTFGYTTGGGSAYPLGTLMHGTVFSSPAGGTVTSISAYGSGSGGSSKLAWGIYNDSDNSINGYTEEWSYSSWSASFKELDMSSGGSIDSANYILVSWGDDDNTNISYDSGADHYYDSESYDYPNFPNTFVEDYGSYDRKESIYATYTPASSAVTKGQLIMPQ